MDSNNTIIKVDKVNKLYKGDGCYEHNIRL